MLAQGVESVHDTLCSEYVVAMPLTESQQEVLTYQQYQFSRNQYLWDIVVDIETVLASFCAFSRSVATDSLASQVLERGHLTGAAAKKQGTNRGVAITVRLAFVSPAQK